MLEAEELFCWAVLYRLLAGPSFYLIFRITAPCHKPIEEERNWSDTERFRKVLGGVFAVGFKLGSTSRWRVRPASRLPFLRREGGGSEAGASLWTPYLLGDGVSSRFCYLHHPFGKLCLCKRAERNRHRICGRRGGVCQSQRSLRSMRINQRRRNSDSASLFSGKSN